MFNIPQDGERPSELDLLALYKASLPPALTDAAIVAAVRTRDIDTLRSGLLRWSLGIVHKKRLHGMDLLDDIQTASLAMLKALPGAAAKAAERPDDELPRCLKGYLRNAIIHALLRAHTATVEEPYRTRRQVEADGRPRVRVESLDVPIDADASPTDPDHGDSRADYVADAERLLGDGSIASTCYAPPDFRLEDAERKQQVHQLLDGAVPPLTSDERAVFTTMRGLVDGIERTAPETAHILNLSAVRTKQLADQALKKVKAGALGERFFSAPEVVNLDRAAEWKVRQGAKRAR